MCTHDASQPMGYEAFWLRDTVVDGGGWVEAAAVWLADQRLDTGMVPLFVRLEA